MPRCPISNAKTDELSIKILLLSFIMLILWTPGKLFANPTPKTITSDPVTTAFSTGLEAFKQGNYQLAHQSLLPIATKNKHADAAQLLGYMHDSGLGTTHDPSHACYWYLQSALSKEKSASPSRSAQAMYKVGECFENKIFTPAVLKAAGLTKLPKDKRYGFSPQNAPYWYLKSAEQGLSRCYCAVGKFLLSHSDYDSQSMTDPGQTMRWCARSGYAGDASAQFYIGMLYASDNIEQTFAQAALWLERAAQQGHSQAAYQLAELYHSHPKLFVQFLNLKRSEYKQTVFKWYETAANLGYDKAYAKVAILYVKQLEDSGTPPTTTTNTKELLKALFWLKTARHALTNPTKHQTPLDQMIHKTIERHHETVSGQVPENWHPLVAQHVDRHFKKFPLKKSSPAPRLSATKTEPPILAKN